MKKKTRSPEVTRRTLLKTGAAVALTGVLPEAVPAVQPARQSVYEALGLKHIINATGTVTTLGASLMPPEVVAAWVDASKHFVVLTELQDKVGERIASLIGVEAALVTTGAAGALQLGCAAAMTRGDRRRISQLPDTTEMKNEVLVQKAHRNDYEYQFKVVGARVVEVETAADVNRLVNNRTALMFFMNYDDAAGRIQRAEWVALARQHNVPTIMDAAADVPPVQRFSEYTRMGFDLVAFSGGKALRGPNDTGLLVGRKDLVDAAKLNTNPHSGTGRALKVSKEDMIAQLATIERFVRLDHQAETREWERRIGLIETAVRDIPTVTCTRVVPAIANHVPHLSLSWDESRVRLTTQRFTQLLRQSDPPIQIGRVAGIPGRGAVISVFMLQAGEDRIVADRVAAILRQAVGA